MEVINDNPARRSGNGRRAMQLLGALLLVLAGLAYLLVPGARQHERHRRPDVPYLTAKEVGFFPFNPVDGNLDDIPTDVRKLDGKRVQIEGGVMQSDLPQFAFALTGNDRPPVQVQERIYVRAGPQSHPEYGRSELLQGIFHVAIKHDDSGNVISLFELDAAGSEER